MNEVSASGVNPYNANEVNELNLKKVPTLDSLQGEGGSREDIIDVRDNSDKSW